MTKKASETKEEPTQDPSSEAKAQEKDSENGAALGQEQLEEIRKGLLGDESFLESVYSSPVIQRKVQSDRDSYVHSQTLPLRQELERANAALEQISQLNNPVQLEIQRLREEGDYEGALKLMEQNQQTAEREQAAEQRGERQAAEKILQAVARRVEFSGLTPEDWKGVYAGAATEATAAGRQYITVDEYVAAATRATLGKEREKIMEEQKGDISKLVEEAVEAQLKAAGVERRKEEGGPENLAGRGGGAGGMPTDEEIESMTQESWNSLSDEVRSKIVAKAAQQVRA